MCIALPLLSEERVVLRLKAGYSLSGIACKSSRSPFLSAIAQPREHIAGQTETLQRIDTDEERCLRHGSGWTDLSGSDRFLNAQFDGLQENAHHHVSVFLLICELVGCRRRDIEDCVVEVGIKRGGEQTVVESFMWGWQG